MASSTAQQPGESGGQGMVHLRLGQIHRARLPAGHLVGLLITIDLDGDRFLQVRETTQIRGGKMLSRAQSLPRLWAVVPSRWV
jgi:hypothetical protein